jgi:HEAT repeat protein
VRESAIFWLGQEAGVKSIEGLEDFIVDDEEDLELREHAVFAISQRDSDEAIPSLMRIATSHEYPQLRKTALFWLAQHDDDRVLDLFEEILEGG